MANVATGTIILQRVSSFSGDYPSATAGSNGFDEVNAVSGDNIVITLRSGNTSGTGGGTANYGYTPNGNTGTGGTLSGFSAFSVTNNPIIVTCANVTSTGFISIWCGPANGGSTVGYRARVKVNIIDNTVDDIELGGWKDGAARNTYYYASTTTGVAASATSAGTNTVTGLSAGVGATLSVALTQGSGTNAEHSVNSTSNYTSNNVTVYNGDVLRYRVLSSSSYLTLVKYKWTLTAPGNSQDDELRIKTVAAPVITPPVISSVTHNNASNSTVTATVVLSSNGSNGTLEYAQSTSNSVPTSGWQISSQFPHTRGATRYYWASQDRYTSGAYSSSVSLYVAPLGTLDLNIGISNYNSPQRYVSNGNALTTVADNTTVVLTGSTSSYQHQLTGCGADTLYYASYTSGSSQGSTTTYSNLSHIGRTFTTGSTRTLNGTSSGSSITSIPAQGSGDRVYIWAVLSPSAVGGSNITNSTTMTYTGSSYIVENPDTNISLAPSSTTITAGSTSNVTVQLTGDTSGTQYRLFTSDIPKWASTFNGNGTSSGGFTISYSQNELPPTGSTYTYFCQARVITGDRDNYWVNTGDSFTITRSNADTDPNNIDSQLTDINPAQTSVQYVESWQTTGVTSGYQIPWTATASSGASVQLSTNNSTWVTGAQGIQRSLNQTGYVRLQTGSAQNTAYTATIKANNVSKGTWTLTTAGSGQQGQQTGGGAAFQYGLEIKNQQGTSTIIDSTSKIGTIVATTAYSIPANNSGQVKFATFDCSNATQTSIIFNSGSQYFGIPYFIRRTAQQQGVVLYPYSGATQTSTGQLYLIRY